MITDKDLFLKSINSYFMKCGKDPVSIVKIKIITRDTDVFKENPIIQFQFKKNDDSLFNYDLNMDIQKFKIYVLEQLNKEGSDFNLLSRKKLKLLIIKYIRKYYLGLVIKNCLNQFDNKQEILNRFMEKIKSNLELINYYNTNLNDCNLEFDNQYNRYLSNIDKYVKNKIHFKHFNIFFDFNINENVQFNKYKSFINKYKKK